MTTHTSGAADLPAIQRYKIGYHSDDWGQRSSTPSGIPDASGSWVRYADHVAALAVGQQEVAPAEPTREFLERTLAAMEGVIDVADRKTAEFDALRSCVIDLTLMLFKPSTRPAPPAMDGGDAVGWFTVVYRGIRPGDEAKALGDHPKASILSWSNAVHDRDAARTAQAAPAPGVPKPEDYEVTLYPPLPTTGFRIGMPNGVRVTHKPTGLFATSESERSQHRNRELAWQELQAKLAAPQPPAPQESADALPTYTDDLELRYVEACEERDHLRELLKKPPAPAATADALDAARLDWIEKHGSVAFERCRYIGADTTVFEVTPFDDDSYDGETLREAIDAAIAAQAKEGGAA